MLYRSNYPFDSIYITTTFFYWKTKTFIIITVCNYYRNLYLIHFIAISKIFSLALGKFEIFLKNVKKTSECKYVALDKQILSLIRFLRILLNLANYMVDRTII